MTDHMTYDITWTGSFQKVLEGSGKFHMEGHGISWNLIEGHGRFWKVLCDSCCVCTATSKVYIRAVVWPPVVLENYPHLVTLTHLCLPLEFSLCVLLLCSPSVSLCSQVMSPELPPFVSSSLLFA